MEIIQYIQKNTFQIGCILVGLFLIYYFIYLYPKPKAIKRLQPIKVIKIDFVDFWTDFQKTNNYFIHLLRRYTNHRFIIDENNPDISLVNIPIHTTQLKESKVIGFIGEPQFKRNPNYHLNFTFDLTKNNNIRFPLWLLYSKPKPDVVSAIFVDKSDIHPDKNLQLYESPKSKFCCWIASNCYNEHRMDFVKELSSYKTVDCGGSCLNNIGYKVDDKIKFQKDYKFCVAYENTKQRGYTTEKILQSYQSNCIPIYFGNDMIQQDFNPETFINAHDFNSTQELIDYIIRVDTDEQLYKSYFGKPIYSQYWLDIFNDPEERYFKNICKRILKD
jgi:alpha(1,3/1,4) fucosyltransferase